MKHAFADTFYWVALAHPKDHWHERAKTLSKSLGCVQIVTTDEVPVEFLTQLESTKSSPMTSILLKKDSAPSFGNK